MYKDEYHPRFKKDLKNIDISAVKYIKDSVLDLILSSPHKAEPLRGVLSGIYSFHFRINKVDYRICYIADDENGIVYFLMVGTRENFYKVLQQRIIDKK